MLATDLLSLVHEQPEGAVFAPDRKHRYLLWRRILQCDLLMPARGICLFNMLNPSTADESEEDPTVRRTIDYASRWGCSTLIVTNMYGWMSTDKEALCGLPDPVGRDNDLWIAAAAAAADIVIAAWGNGPSKLDIRPRARHVLRLIDRPTMCLGITEEGNPWHPLYRPKTFQPIPYTSEFMDAAATPPS